jgi:hypothetical protein
VQRGRAQLAEYWRRVKLQDDVRVAYQVLAAMPAGGIAHWHVTYQVASEELFRIGAGSTGTNLIAREPGDPLPRGGPGRSAASLVGGRAMPRVPHLVARHAGAALTVAAPLGASPRDGPTHPGPGA